MCLLFTPYNLHEHKWHHSKKTKTKTKYAVHPISELIHWCQELKTINFPFCKTCGTQHDAPIAIKMQFICWNATASNIPSDILPRQQTVHNHFYIYKLLFLSKWTFFVNDFSPSLSLFMLLPFHFVQANGQAFGLEQITHSIEWQFAIIIKTIYICENICSSLSHFFIVVKRYCFCFTFSFSILL